jgi:hypothetical protein
MNVAYTLRLLFFLIRLGRDNDGSDNRSWGSSRSNCSLLSRLPSLLNKAGEADNLRVTVRIRVALDVVRVADVVIKAACLE